MSEENESWEVYSPFSFFIFYLVMINCISGEEIKKRKAKGWSERPMFICIKEFPQRNCVC